MVKIIIHYDTEAIEEKRSCTIERENAEARQPILPLFNVHYITSVLTAREIGLIVSSPSMRKSITTIMRAASCTVNGDVRA